MSTPEDYGFNPQELALERMREELFSRGWEVSVNERDVSTFVRAYARVNPLLEGNNWPKVVHNFVEVLDKRAPDLPRGLGLGVSGDDTEVTIKLLAGKDNKSAVTKAYLLDAYLRENGFEEIDETSLANWINLKGEPGAPRLGSKEHYEQSPRATELRGLCIEIIDIYRRVVDSEGMEGGAMERLLELNQRLAQLAIEPNMHIEIPSVEFIDPVKRAEWVSGMLRHALQEGFGFSGRAREILEAHDLLDGTGGDMQLIGPNSPPEAKDNALLLVRLAQLAEHLDAQADRPEM